MPEYTWKVLLENAIEMVMIIASDRESKGLTFRNHDHFASSYRSQWKQLALI